MDRDELLDKARKYLKKKAKKQEIVVATEGEALDALMGFAIAVLSDNGIKLE